MCGSEPDLTEPMAVLSVGTSARSDLALVEASLSARAFMNLVILRVSFQVKHFGGFSTGGLHPPEQYACFEREGACRILKGSRGRRLQEIEF